jgi:hypothetical protein
MHEQAMAQECKTRAQHQANAMNANQARALTQVETRQAVKEMQYLEEQANKQMQQRINA